MRGVPVGDVAAGGIHSPGGVDPDWKAAQVAGHRGLDQASAGGLGDQDVPAWQPLPRHGVGRSGAPHAQRGAHAASGSGDHQARPEGDPSPIGAEGDRPASRRRFSAHQDAVAAGRKLEDVQAPVGRIRYRTPRPTRKGRRLRAVTGKGLRRDPVRALRGCRGRRLCGPLRGGPWGRSRSSATPAPGDTHTRGGGKQNQQAESPTPREPATHETHRPRRLASQ